jgi:hypothetical protein
MAVAVATVLAAIVAGVSTVYSGEQTAAETEAASKRSLALANITRQDTLAQNAVSNKLAQGQLALGKQNLLEQQRQFNTQMNQNTMGNIFKTIGDAAMKSATFKNYLLNRAGI